MNELNVIVSPLASGAQLPAIVWNEKEVKANLDELLAAYQGRVYTEDDIKGAKADRAAVNKLDKQLGDALAAVKKRYAEPVEAFADKIKSYRAQVKEVSLAIDTQVKAAENTKKAEKQEQLRQVYEANIGSELAELIPFEKLLNPRWLNATVTLSSATQELLSNIEACRSDLELLRNNCGEDFPAAERVYIKDLSVRDAMGECSRLKAAREAQARAEEARRAEEAVRAAAPVVVRPSEEELAAREMARERSVMNAIITEEGRLDFSGLQTFAEPERKRYELYVYFTAEDIKWFKDAAKSRGFKFGAIN